MLLPVIPGLDPGSPNTVWYRLKHFRSLAIPSESIRKAFATLRFHPEVFRRLSQRCDFVWKCSGSFRNTAISSESLQEAFATLRFRPGVFRKLSQHCDFILECSGSFRNVAIPSESLQDVFASLRFHLKVFRKLSQHCDFLYGSPMLCCSEIASKEIACRWVFDRQLFTS
jgi:hypothetical protein